MGNKWSRHANRGGPVHFTPRWMRAAAATDTSLPVNLAHQLSPATTTPAEPTMAAKAFRGGGSGTTASRSVRPSIRRWGSRRDARNLALAPNLPPPHPPANRSRRRGMAINRWMTHGCCCCCCGSTNQLRSHTNTAIICQVMKMY